MPPSILPLKRKKIDVNGEVYYEFKNAYFNSKAFTITNSDQIIDALDQASEEINNRVAVWLSEGSGWVVESILGHYINIVQYIPLRGNSYIPLTEELRNSSKGLINLKNKDDKCFLWSHVRHLNLSKHHSERITESDKEFAKKLDYSGITFPVTVKQIEQIEKQNEININLFGYYEKGSYEKGIYPIQISEEKYRDHMELLYIVKEVKDDLHY